MSLKQKSHHWLALLLAMVFTLTVNAQNIAVKGTVVDDTGEPLIGATVLQKGTGNGVATDIDGNFDITVPSKATLVVSYVGYDNQEVKVNGQKTLNVVLKSNSTMLDEVVAIGYGTVKKKDLTGAVSSVSGSELVKVPATSAAAALQGKAAGLNIVSQSSAPGAGLNITVRGGTSLTQGTEPLYIVDGFAMDNALSNIDINDIESIEVLKDASATAIYGARGSNGIIVITTKSAKKGKTKVDYNGFVSFDRLSKKLSMVDNALDYVRYQYDFAANQNKLAMWTNAYNDRYATDNADFYTGAYGRIDDMYADSYGVDWQNETFGGTALTQNHNVSVTVGSDKVQALVSYNYNGQDGLLANHDFARNSIRAKINAELWRGVKMDFSTFFYNNDTHGGGAYSGMKNVLLQPINGGTLFSEADLIGTQTFPTYRGLDASYDTANPLVQNEASTSRKRSRRFDVNAGITIDFLNHFTWRTAGNYVTKWDKSNSFADERSTSYLVDQANTGMNGSIGNSESYSWHITNTLNYNQTFNDKHTVTALLGQEYSYSESEGVSLSLKQFPNPNHGLDDISGATVSSKSTSHGHSNMLSFFGRVNYNFDDRYLVTATLRGDGSSKFAKGHKWGVFPSASAAWRISQEKFFENSPVSSWWNNLKLRVGYGVTGNNNIGSNLYTTKLIQTTYPNGTNVSQPAYILDSTLGNPDLKWETLHATNVGLDLGMFNNRINLTVEWYNNQISDMLMKCTIPAGSGYSSQYQNVGKMRNRGWEIQLNTVNIHAGGFQWTSNLNLSFNRSKVLSLETEETDSKLFSVGGNRSGTLRYYATVGEALGDMYGYKYEGIYTTDDFEQVGNKLVLKEGVVKPEKTDPQPGDIKFAANDVDANGNPIFKAGTYTKIGNGSPDCTGGFGNQFTYKGFDLNVFLKFSIGNDIYNATKHSMTPYAPYQNIPAEFLKYFHNVDPLTGQVTTDLARLAELNPNQASSLWNLSTTNTGYITNPSSFYVEDGSYLRLAQVSLGYTFPSKWMKKAYISNLRIYFTANNLATWTKYSGYNPDTSSANDNVICTPGYDSSAYPLSRSYVIGVNLSF